MSQPPGFNPEELLTFLNGIIAQCEAQQRLIEQTVTQVRELELLLRKPAVTFSEPPTKDESWPTNNNSPRQDSP